MNLKKISSAALAVLALGMVAPACAPAPDESLGQLCALSEVGKRHCVRSNVGPAAAWQQAMADGGLPIQMWAERPDAVTLEQLVTSKDKLHAWYADIDTVLTYVRDTKRSAESYKASMDGILGDLLNEANQRQAAVLLQDPVDAIGDFKKALSDRASAEKSPIVAAIAGDKLTMTDVRAVLDKAKSDAAPLALAYADVASQFTAYRATEAAETQAYTALAQQASQSTLATLPAIEQAILAAAQGASAKPSELSLSTMKLSAQIQAFAGASEAALTPHADFLATHGAARPDTSSSALRSLNAMLGYMERRVARSDAVAVSLLQGTAMRAQALVLLGDSSSSAKSTGAFSRDQIAQDRLLQASTIFSDTAQKRVDALAAALPKSKSLALPYLAPRYDQATALLQMEPLCDPSSSSWREAGCVSLRKSFSAAEVARKTELPKLLASGIALMRQKGADAALLDAAQARLDAGDTKGAAILHDAAVRGTEGT
jgi:hypothetical protein